MATEQAIDPKYKTPIQESTPTTKSTELAGQVSDTSRAETNPHKAKVNNKSEIEIPPIHQGYVEVIFQKMGKSGGTRGKRNAAILRKFFFEEKNVNVIHQEIRKQYGESLGFDPIHFTELVNEIVEQIKTEYGYEFPEAKKYKDKIDMAAYREILSKKGQGIARTPDSSKAADPENSKSNLKFDSSIILLNPEQSLLLQNMDQTEFRKVLAPLELELFVAFYENNTEPDHLLSILKSHQVSNPSLSMAKQKLSIIISHALKLARQQQKEQQFPDQDKGKLRVAYGLIKKWWKGKNE